MPKELPYFRWYPADAESDFRYSALSLPELGLFHRCLNFSWLNYGLPADPMEIGRSLRISSRDIKTLWPRVSECFELRDGRTFNRRQEEERIHARTKSERNTSAVRTRYERTSNVPTNEVQHARARAASPSVSGSVFGSEEEKPSLRNPLISSEELESAWDRHNHHSGKEPKQLIFQNVLSMDGNFDPVRFRDRHPKYCEHYENHKKGWEAFGVLTFWGWISAGMPEPKKTKSEQEADEYFALRERLSSADQ